MTKEKDRACWQQGTGPDTTMQRSEVDINSVPQAAAAPKALPDTVSSRAVSWYPVHEYVQPVLNRIGPHPMVGTPEWCALPDDSPAKIAAVFDAAQHWALRIETCQEARAEASKAIAVAEDWPAIADEIRGRRDAYIRRAS